MYERKRATFEVLSLAVGKNERTAHCLAHPKNVTNSSKTDVDLAHHKYGATFGAHCFLCYISHLVSSEDDFCIPITKVMLQTVDFVELFENHFQEYFCILSTKMDTAFSINFFFETLYLELPLALGLSG